MSNFPVAVVHREKYSRFSVREASRRKKLLKLATREAEFPVSKGAAVTGTIGCTVFTMGAALERFDAAFPSGKAVRHHRRPEHVFVKTV